ncbi:MAG: DUF58 domain-containing protein [Acidimicrobiales bacterium]
MRLLPTRRLALVAALASVGVWAAPGDSWLWLLAVDGGLVALAIVDGLLGPPPRAIAVERRLPAGATLGGEGDLTWTIRNPTRRAARVLVADELAPSLRATTRDTGGRIPGRGQLQATVRLRPARRGRFRPRRVVVRVEGPLGLGARQGVRDLPGELRVFPSFRSKDEAELRIRRARMLEVGLRSARGRGGGTEFEQLREYGVDDEFRRIDWAATARSGKAIVRTYRSEQNQTVLALLDNGRVMAGRVDGVPRVEHAMDAVMALTTVATGLGDRCGLVAFDRDIRAVVPPRHGAGQLARVVDALYDLEPALVESDYAEAFSETLARFRRRTMLVILTDLVEHTVNEWLVPALPLIVKEHLVVVAGVADPDVTRWADNPPTDRSSVYRTAAAVSAIGERQRAVARLRGLGATVVDARPGRLASVLADTYLDIKATGRL